MTMALPRQFFRSYHMVFLVGIALCTTVSVNAQCPSNNVEFCSYYRLAEQGLAKAQYNLGWMYSKGEGIAQDKREAVRWYRKAAEQGDASAQYNLGAMYYNGEGVITDNREAYIWVSIAKANGYEGAASALRDINWHLSDSEIASARREAARRLDDM